jgi:hypothetical protein
MELLKQFKYEKYLNILEMKDAILFCTLCNSSQIGDEYNYVFECNYFNKKRKQSLSNYYINRHTIKFSELKRKAILKKLCHFIRATCTLIPMFFFQAHSPL